MSSEGNRLWRCPSSDNCWFVQLLVPESRMLSEPETLSAGPPGPSRLRTGEGSRTGIGSEIPVRCWGVSRPSELMSRRARSCQRSRKFRCA